MDYDELLSLVMGATVETEFCDEAVVFNVPLTGGNQVLIHLQDDGTYHAFVVDSDGEELAS